MENDRTLIVVPTYNERENVGALTAQLLQVAPDAEVMLVDDNSPDGTAAAAGQLFGTNARFSILSRTGPHSYGRSLVDGYRVALERGYSCMVQLDADFSHDPNMVPVLISATRDADVVIGSRYCQGGRVMNWPWHRRFLSRFANEYVAHITGVTVRDSTSGFRCYTRRALRCLLEIGITSEGYAFQVETIFHAQREGLRIVEIPITFTDRRAGQSKMSRKVIFESALKPWRLRFER
ncbi:MAG TPA: polyprenol monophosphomannose synthase [Chthoniobacterales bacterium]|jgi:dolichol-phosphate mannosyltransferase|nr:polyprenol monophosphomannose synthase [Chthoniobacterales bacterium]